MLAIIWTWIYVYAHMVGSLYRVIWFSSISYLSCRIHAQFMLSPLEKVIPALQNAPSLEESSLEVVIHEDKQRGVFTKYPICKVHFVAEYAGELITMEFSQQRKMEYQMNDEGCYILNIGEDEAVDATTYFGRVGNHAS